MAPFKTKVCGIRVVEDVQACVDAGVDCVGLNFYPPSVRYLDPESATTAAINQAARDAGLYRVGLFVNESPEVVLGIAQAFKLDAIQFHGDETVSEVTRFLELGYAVIRAIRLPTDAMTPSELQQRVEDWSHLPITLLLDADAGSQFGGGGNRLDWPSVAAWTDQFAGDLTHGWVLAGGLKPESVKEAIRVSKALSTDVASGVESSRGNKSADLIQKFAEARRRGGVDGSP